MLDSLKLPAIVVVTYNRTESLKRLLNSIDRADYTGYENVPLVISVDKSDRSEVLDLATSFVWKHGSKEIIEHKTNLGLRKHIISCGDLSDQYEAVIVLEDDLLVSPAFYDYAVQAMNFYADADEIGGIGLYSYNYNDWVRLPFIPLDDGFDNYFFQCATSWGQLWTRNQWHGFKQWYETNSHVLFEHDQSLPNSVKKWPQSSWKKYFVAYLVYENKFFVYSRTALVTTFSTIGTHVKNVTMEYQVPLLLQKKKFRFSRLEKSLSVYDVFYEILPKCLKTLNPELEDLDFECDFYGAKALETIKSKYLVSIRTCEKPIKSYSIHQLPQELNLVFDIAGDFFNLAEVDSFGEINQRTQRTQFIALWKGISMSRCWDLYFHSLFGRLKKKLNLLQVRTK